ncbi:MAG: hypothetical protein LBI28_04770 [Treponema sp.]|nr:hypothetical protein [Treponema sp.]
MADKNIDMNKDCTVFPALMAIGLLIVGIVLRELSAVIAGFVFIPFAVAEYLWRKKWQLILKCGHDGFAQFIRYKKFLARFGWLYSICYSYTDENGKYYEVKSRYCTYYQGELQKFKRMDKFPIKFIGKDSIICVDL